MQAGLFFAKAWEAEITLPIKKRAVVLAVCMGSGPGSLPLRRVRRVPIGRFMLDRGEHLYSRIAAVIAIAGTLCLVVSGSSAAGQAIVPDVMGLNVDSAYYDLHHAGFAVQIDEPIAMDAVVVHQSSGPGTKGHAGSPVVLDLEVRHLGERLRPARHGLCRH